MKTPRTLWFVLGGIAGFAILKRLAAPSDATVVSDPSLDPVISTARAIQIGRASRNPLSEHTTVHVAFDVRLTGLASLLSAEGLAERIRGGIPSILNEVATRFDGNVLPSPRFAVNVVRADGLNHVRVDVPISYTSPLNADLEPFIRAKLRANEDLGPRLVGEIRMTES